MSPTTMHHSAEQRIAVQMNVTRKAVRYRRISGKSQKDNFSLRNQDVRSARYCDSKNLPVDKIFTDVGSGLSVKGRPGFLEMFDYVLDKRNGVTDVVFNDIDRFARNYREFFDYIDRMVKAGITVHSAIDDEEYNYASEEKWTDRAVAAQKESKRISIRTKEGQRTATELGYHIGRPPWGYMLEHETDELDEEGYHTICGKLVPDPDLWPHVLEFWRMAEEGTIPMSLARHMRLLGVPSPRGQGWTADTVRGIMKNRKYFGLLFRGENPQSRIPGPQEDASPIFRKNNHDAAVSPEGWKTVNQGIASRNRSRAPTRSHSSPNPLSNFLKCGHCALQGIDSNLELQRQKDKLAVRCSRKKKMGADVCDFKSANLTTLLERIRDRLVHHFLTPESLARVVDGVAEASRPMIEQRQTQSTHIRERKQEVNTEIKNISDVLKEAGAQAPNLQSLIHDLAKLEKERADLEKEGNQIDEATEEALLFVNDPAGIIETALDYKTWTDPEDPEAIKEFLRIFIEKVEVFELEEGATSQRAVIHYDLPAFSAGAKDASATETIHIGKKKPLNVSADNCGLDGFTGMTARHTRKVPVRLTLTVFTQSAMSLPCNGPTGPDIPALLTSTSMRPNRSTTRWASRSVSSCRVTSVGTAMASAPSSETTPTASASSALLRAASASFAPSRA